VATVEIRKAAVLLMNLPHEQTAQLLSLLAPRQVAAIRAEIAKSGSITAAERQAVMLEFADAELDPVLPPPFEFLRLVDPQDLLLALADECPQTIALILSHVPASYAGKVLASFRDDLRRAVLGRIAAIDEPDPEIVSEVERGLQRRVDQVTSRIERLGRVAAVVQLLRGTGRATDRRVLENLAQDDPALVAEIHRLTGARSTADAQPRTASAA
jgi:flagellar motor switch protein FliG